MTKITMHIILGIVLTLPGLTSAGNYVSDADLAAQSNAKFLTDRLARLNEIVGKTFWIEPNPGARSRQIFLFQIPYYSDYSLANKFHPTTTTSFKIVELVTIPDSYSQTLDRYCYRIKFADGQGGYIPISPIKGPFEKLYKDGEYLSSLDEYVFAENPADVRRKKLEMKQAIAEDERRAELARIRAKENADKAWKARQARGGVRIGMTKAQVLRSSWGRPESINSTTTIYGTREQWIYGNGNYLYFQNSVLTSIQN